MRLLNSKIHKDRGRMLVARGWGDGVRDVGRCWPKGTKLQLHRMSAFWRPNVQHGD